ncbi:gamma-tubulin complex component 3 [Mucor ambiguus]|uniref:Gamma-tubulin complex component 3 n=1 Tax=Mucor ambiguus TaxID=91626 RepID=A0A0C9LW47_9FUNG|nr:gamma-tubulin complex component 3 [Mucor ambiguus]
MSYSDINWTQRSRYNDQARSSHSRISLLSTPTEEPSFVRNATTANTTTAHSHLNKTLSKLIDRFDISPRNASLGDIQRQKDRLVDKFSRILSTQLETSIVENENDIANTIHTQLQESRDPEKAHRFGHLYNKLASRQILEKKWSILYLLSLTGELPSSSTSDLSTLDSPRATVSGLQNLHHETPVTAADYLQPPTSRPYDTHSSDSPRNIRRRLATENASPQRESMELDAAPPAVQLARAREAHGRMSEAIYVSEADLLRDLIFLFQGIDGQYIRYDTQLNDHVFTPGIEVSPPITNMVFKLADIGWLYTKVRNFVNDNMDSPTIGLVGQSLCAALQQELTEYYKLIAILEAQVEKQMINNQVTSQSLTLKKLMIWTLDCNQKLRLMSVLVDVCQGQKGGALIAAIHNYTKHGDPFIKNYLTKMLQIVSKPFYEMLERWVYEGELDDPYEEFFVACDRTVPEEELWQSKYTMREDMLPAFLSKELAHKIFSIGKSLNFIRYSCHEDTLAEQHQGTFASTAETPTNTLDKQPFKYGETEQVGKSIEVAYTATSRALLNLLKTKYKLMDHLKALKRYLLLGQGDFIQYLMDILWMNLSKPANTLFRHNLTGILETAIRSCNAQYDDPQILNRLDVRLMEIQKDDLGWDVFSLDYHVDAPINTVFSPTAMHQYLEAFNFLWRLKRVEYTLAAAWRQWVKASREFTQLPELQQDIQFAQLTIQRMIHFIYQLQHYVLFEVLECSWDKLETFIEHKSVDLDSIIAAHNNYLGEITEKGFLTGPKQEALAGKLGSIFNCILQYNIVLEYLYKYATQESLKRSSRGLSDVETMSKIRKRHEDMEDQFTMQVLGFLDVLKSYHDEDLRSLSTRLDYNDFYTKFNDTSQNVNL